MAMSIDDRARQAREQDEAEEIAAWRAEMAWNELQGVPSHFERYARERYEREQREMAERAERRATFVEWVDRRGGQW